MSSYQELDQTYWHTDVLKQSGFTANRSTYDCIVTLNNIAQKFTWLWSSNLRSLLVCQFACCLWFTQLIIALVTADQALDSRQDIQD